MNIYLFTSLYVCHQMYVSKQTKHKTFKHQTLPNGELRMANVEHIGSAHSYENYEKIVNS